MDEEDYILPQGASFQKNRHAEQKNNQGSSFSETFGKWVSDNMVTIMIGFLVIILGVLLYYWFTRSEPEPTKKGAPQVKPQKRQQQSAPVNDEDDETVPVVDIPEEKPVAKKQPMKKMSQDRPEMTENKNTNTINWNKLRKQREEEKKRNHNNPIVVEEEYEDEEDENNVQVEYQEDEE